MPALPTTLRYRTYPTSTTPRGLGSSVPFEKEPERDPEADCFMCRQAHVYVKPIGMQQELRVGANQPPPLTREEIEELSQKKELSKKEVRKLLQCYFPEIKDVKYFQLHRYHSCCYNPKHLNLCKNHITALQNEREQHPGHYHGNEGDSDNSTDPNKQNRVSFVRIKIEPTKGIPTRFLGPAALPEPLADMLLKQVSRFEKKKRSQSVSSNHKNDSGFDVYEDTYNYDSDNNHVSIKPSKSDGTTKQNSTKRKKTKLKHWEILALQQSNVQTCNCRHHVSRVEGDQLVYDWCRCRDHNHKNLMDRRQSISATGEPSPREVRLKLDQVAYDWCKCSTHRHGKTSDRRKSVTLPSLSQRETHSVNDHESLHQCDCQDPQYKVKVKVHQHKMTSPPSQGEKNQTLLTAEQHTEPIRSSPKFQQGKQRGRARQRGENKYTNVTVTQRNESVQVTPPPAVTRVVQRGRRDESKHTASSISQRDESIQSSPIQSRSYQKRRGTLTRTVAVDAREPSSTELALAYDPSAVDYEVIQEAIYYRTSSGRLIKPEITSSFTYDDALAAVTRNQRAPHSNREQIYYTTKNGYMPEEEIPRRRRNVDRPMSRSLVLSNPGSVYRGQAYADPEYTPAQNGGPNGIPVLKLPTIQSSGRQSHYDNSNEHQPAEFTLAKFSNADGETLPSQRTTGANSTGGWKTVQMSMQQSTKPTFINNDPTPNFEQRSSVVANRRWFDQPLGDQNLGTVHDNEYGVIAAPSSDVNHSKSQSVTNKTKKENNCTIS
ncbi:unnamed protein product [Adineta ricciae]|uniref:Uncharacterized protein n=1 Tax=Adineta ricciae TaxID=249248 RepID=A0A813MWH7_ADIRI|nr:unnamed protein product [Adineta ricciae]CAF1253304.1 unnamed protein product [Adineta ricciae]